MDFGFERTRKIWSGTWRIRWRWRGWLRRNENGGGVTVSSTRFLPFLLLLFLESKQPASHPQPRSNPFQDTFRPPFLPQFPSEQTSQSRSSTSSKSSPTSLPLPSSDRSASSGSLASLPGLFATRRCGARKPMPRSPSKQRCEFQLAQVKAVDGAPAR